MADHKPNLAFAMSVSNAQHVRGAGRVAIGHDAAGQKMGHVHTVHRDHFIAIPEARAARRGQGIDIKHDD